MHNNIFLALFNTTIRVLKCNPLFKTGFDYPVIYYKKKNILSIYKINKEKIVFFLIPIKKNKFFIIQK